MKIADKIEDLATPFLLIDGAKTRDNIQRMASYAANHKLRLRPHTKTHKSLRLAQHQLEAGAIGLTVAKVGEAETLAAVCKDILVAYPIVDAQRAERLARLAETTNLTVAIDSQMSARVLDEALRTAGTEVGILVDMDVGYGRTGLQTVSQTIELASLVDRCQALRLRGLFVYPGHIRGTQTEQQPLLESLIARLDETIAAWQQQGLCTDVISGGSTPTAYNSHLIPQLTEFRPGTYVYNDMNIVRGGYCDLSQCAATIVATVVSNAVPHQVILDAGSKTLTSDLCGPAPDAGYGYVIDFPDAHITRLTEEHAQVDISQCPTPPRLGQRVHVIPNHICVCVNLQDQVWWRDAQTSDTIESVRVDGRGLLC